MNLEQVAQKEFDYKERVEVKNEQEIFFEEKKLKTFSKIIGDSEYYIGGGLAIELLEGKLKHRHGDIDIIIFEDEVDNLRGNLLKQGFDVQQKPKFKGHDLDARNFDVDEEDGSLIKNPPEGQEPLDIGLFVYEKNEERGMAQQSEEDGIVNKEFPLSYFNREKQTLDYKGDKLIVADLRLVVSLKTISERPKDLEDIKRMMPLLKSKFTKQELDEMKDICKSNIKTRDIASIKYMFENFLKTDQEINAENIYNYFLEDLKKVIAEKKDIKYSEAVREFLENIKEFSLISKDKEKNKKDFLLFVSDKLKPVIDYQNNVIDETLK